MTTSVSSTVNNWIVKPSRFSESSAQLLSSRPGIKDMVDVFDTALSWVPFFTQNVETLAYSKHIKKELAPISHGLAVFSLFTGLHGLKRNIEAYFTKDDESAGLKVFNSTLGTMNAASETAMFLDSAKIAPLKEWMKTASGVFWGTTALLCGVDFFQRIEQVEDLKQAIAKEKNVDVRSIREDELNIAYLQIVKDVSTVALAAIILVSLVYASITSYLLFSPVVQLGLTTGYFVLHFIEYYYSDYVSMKKADLTPFAIKA